MLRRIAVNYFEKKCFSISLSVRLRRFCSDQLSADSELVPFLLKIHVNSKENSCFYAIYFIF